MSFDDLKPGDTYHVPKKVRVIDNPAKLYLQLTDFESTQGAQTEPEEEEEQKNGIRYDLQSVLAYALVFNEQTVFDLAQQKSLEQLNDCWIPLGEINPSVTYDMEQSFYLPVEVTNWSQGDQLNFSEVFYVVQSRNTENFQPPSSFAQWDEAKKECIHTSGSFSDDFNNNTPDGWWLGYSQHTPWVQGNWRIENGNLFQDQAGDDFIALKDGFQISDQTVEVQIKINGPSGYGGTTLWFKDDNNYVNVRLYPAIGVIQVVEKINGVFTSSNHPYPSLQNNTWYRIRSIVHGTSGVIDVYLNNTFVFSYTATTQNRVGRTGVNNGNAGSAFDNFQIF